MDRKSLVLAALAPAKGDTYTPVQIQKLLFLIDKNIPSYIGGHLFNFEPYDYGPFDKSVYDILDLLYLGEMIEIIEVPGHSWKKYRLTDKGLAAGQTTLNSIESNAREYIVKVSEFVRKLSFAALVSSIYHAYPEMKVNSVLK